MTKKELLEILDAIGARILSISGGSVEIESMQTYGAISFDFDWNDKLESISAYH